MNGKSLFLSLPVLCFIMLIGLTFSCRAAFTCVCALCGCYPVSSVCVHGSLGFDCRLVLASSLPAAGDDDVIDVDDVTPGDGETETPQEYMRRVGPPIPGPPGKWASCIRVFDPVSVS